MEAVDKNLSPDGSEFPAFTVKHDELVVIFPPALAKRVMVVDGVTTYEQLHSGLTLLAGVVSQAIDAARAAEHTAEHINLAQETRLRALCAGYKVEYNPLHYTTMFDLPKGYVGGWVGGKPGTLFVGVSPEGEPSS